jgi:polyhydroxyalkanoate synthase
MHCNNRKTMKPDPPDPPDRRLRPRPLPAHLTSSALLWLSSRAALTSLNSESKAWNGNAAPLHELAGEIRQHGADAVARALDRYLAERAKAFITGIESYRRHPYRRAAPDVPVRWACGSAQLLDYGGPGSNSVVLLVPSLINRHYVLDPLPERSFVRFLAARGLRPLVLDWGEPGSAERNFGLDDYIAGHLDGALSAATAIAGGPVSLCGYCMGGLLSLAAACRQFDAVASLTLLATPWDFHADREVQVQLLGGLAEWLPRLLPGDGPIPVPVIQSLFAALDPFLAERKFVRFAGLAAGSDAARDFVALEDWINDGVPLARKVSVECARSWYRDNDPMLGKWHVAGRPVLPSQISAPVLIVLPDRDRIVPPRSAAALADAMPHAELLRPPLGHIGMMSSARAPAAVWAPIADWLITAGRTAPPQ